MNKNTYIIHLRIGGDFKEFSVTSDTYSPTREFCTQSQKSFLRVGSDAEFPLDAVVAVIKQPAPQPAQ